jgi:hypothetical protein
MLIAYTTAAPAAAAQIYRPDAAPATSGTTSSHAGNHHGKSTSTGHSAQRRRPRTAI